ncbi:hypothetical protein [Deminuibacter soli]|uniref:Uncharacterized protein n=1 Tax=Deminuibacter soli TaxID=2291815 RepID=A0A3E1NPN2_9BACT|nr:hypothetical protein [Deminuibacter soli]RFM29873.1 hypothetical protein DXN05_02545 [Deminuibacter soli]
MRSRYWVQYSLLFAMCSGSVMAIEYHKAVYHKKSKVQCDQCRPGCPMYREAPKTGAQTDYILWHPVNRFIG